MSSDEKCPECGKSVTPAGGQMYECSDCDWYWTADEVSNYGDE